MTSDISKCIDLGAGRNIAFQQRGQTYQLCLRQATEKDWFNYFDHVIVTAEQRGREVIRITEAGAAGLELVESLLISVKGYPVAPEYSMVEEIQNWKAKIPIAHRMAALEVLLDARAIESDDDEPLIFDQETVRLEALWSANGSGEMKRVTGLKHVFRAPEIEHVRMYMNQISRSKVVGGSRSGKTIYGGAQRVLCAIYDELIFSVTGYCVNGRELQSTEIPALMDSRHKVAAAERLFASIEVER